MWPERWGAEEDAPVGAVVGPAGCDDGAAGPADDGACVGALVGVPEDDGRAVGLGDGLLLVCAVGATRGFAWLD